MFLNVTNLLPNIITGGLFGKCTVKVNITTSLIEMLIPFLFLFSDVEELEYVTSSMKHLVGH